MSNCLGFSRSSLSVMLCTSFLGVLSKSRTLLEIQRVLQILTSKVRDRLKKGYRPYEAYQYLEPGKDFKIIDWADWDWAGRNAIELNEEEEARCGELLAKYPYISLHDHPDFTTRDMSTCEPLFDAMRIFAAKKAGKIAMVFVVEGAAPIENEVDRIDILYGLGVRQLGVTYSESNALGNGCKEVNDGGLTMFGKQCVERMNKVGMLIDVSHCGPKTAYDAVTYSKKPIIASHIGAKGVWNTKRMASDEMIQAIAQKGGVIGIEAAPHTTMSKTNMTHDLDSFMEHFEYVKNMVGIDHVGFGVDCLYGDHVGVHHAFAQALSIASTSKVGVGEYQEVPFVRYLENPTESSWNIVRWLVKHEYSDEDIAKVIGGNAIRVLREVWA